MTRTTNAEVIAKHEESVRRRARLAACAIVGTYLGSMSDDCKEEIIQGVTKIIVTAMGLGSRGWRGAGVGAEAGEHKKLDI